MGSNPVIQAIPVQQANPTLHIKSFLKSIQPFKLEHSRAGASYFARSRDYGDAMLEEDVIRDYVRPPASPPPRLLSPATEHALSHITKLVVRVVRETQTQLPNERIAEMAVQAVREALAEQQRERGKHGHKRVSGPRPAPYPVRPRARDQDVDDIGVVGEATRAPTSPDVEQQRQLSNATGRLQRGHASLDRRSHDLTAPLASGQATRCNVRDASDVDDMLPRLRRDDRHRPDSVPARAGRLTIPRGGIFARGVASKPLKVAGQQHRTVLPLASAVFDEKRFLGLDKSSPPVVADSPDYASPVGTDVFGSQLWLPSTAGVLSSPPAVGIPSPVVPSTQHEDVDQGSHSFGYVVAPHQVQLATNHYRSSHFYPMARDQLADPLPSQMYNDTTHPWPRAPEPAYRHEEKMVPIASADYFQGRLQPLVQFPNPNVSPTPEDYPVAHLEQRADARAVSADPPRPLPLHYDWQRPVSAPPKQDLLHAAEPTLGLPDHFAFDAYAAHAQHEAYSDEQEGNQDPEAYAQWGHPATYETYEEPQNAHWAEEAYRSPRGSLPLASLLDGLGSHDPGVDPRASPVGGYYESSAYYR